MTQIHVHPNIRVVIIGDGPLRQEFEELSITLGIEWATNFTGWLSRSEMGTFLLQSVDVIVNTGAWLEIFNNANLEVMALGIPLVTFASGGVGEYILQPKQQR